MFLCIYIYIYIYISIYIYIRFFSYEIDRLMGGSHPRGPLNPPGRYSPKFLICSQLVRSFLIFLGFGTPLDGFPKPRGSFWYIKCFVGLQGVVWATTALRACGGVQYIFIYSYVYFHVYFMPFACFCIYF